MFSEFWLKATNKNMLKFKLLIFDYCNESHYLSYNVLMHSFIIKISIIISRLLLIHVKKVVE